MKEDKDKHCGEDKQQIGRKRNKSAEQRRCEKRRRLASRTSRERNNIIDHERKLTAQASRQPTRSGSRREDDRRRREEDADNHAPKKSGSSRERRQKKERRHSRSRSRDRQRRRSSSRDMKRDDRKDQSSLRRGYILYPSTSRKHIGFNLSPRSHAIKAAEMEYQNKRMRKKSPRNRSPHAVKIEKYEPMVLPTAKLSYLPRETQEDKERRKQVEQQKAVPIKLVSTPIVQIDNNQSIPGVSSKYLQNSSTGQTFRTKIFLPKFQGINYVGLIIGPKGIYQKKLEDKTACKILIRGKGSHKDGHPMSQSDQDDQHVLIIGNTEDSVAQAKKIVEKVLTADESQRNQIRSEQLKDAQELSKDLYRHDIEDFMLTPYGPPSPYAVIIAIPNECVGLIIGKGGETIRHLQVRSGCKIQVAKKEIPDDLQKRLAAKGHTGAILRKSYHHMRYVFIEGQDRDKYEPARQLIQKIIEDHKQIQENFAKGGETNPFPGPHTTYFIPDIATDMLIGADGKVLRQIYQRTNCYIFVSAEVNDKHERMLQFSGGTGPSVQHLLQQGKHKQVQDFYRPPEEELEPFGLTPAEYLSLQSVDKCKLEIRIRLRKLEQFAMKNELQLCTETVLKFLKEEAAETETSMVADAKNTSDNSYMKCDDDNTDATATTKTGNGKQKLVETARMEEELLNGAEGNSFLGFTSMNSNTFQSLGSALIVKTEPCSGASTSPGSVVKAVTPTVKTSSGGSGIELSIHQESQKDFLFDPYAAAYYERFVGFVPGAKVLRFEDLKWPALQDNDRYTQAQLKFTYFQAYKAIYGEPEPQAGSSIVRSIRDVVMENQEDKATSQRPMEPAPAANKVLPSPLQSFQSFHQSFNNQQERKQDEVEEPSNLQKLFMRCFGDIKEKEAQVNHNEVARPAQQHKTVELDEMLNAVKPDNKEQAKEQLPQLQQKEASQDQDAALPNSQDSAASLRSLQKLQKFSKIIRKCKKTDDRGEKLKYLERLRQSSDRESRRGDGVQSIMLELGNVAQQIALEDSAVASQSCISISQDGVAADQLSLKKGIKQVRRDELAMGASQSHKKVERQLNLDPEIASHKPVTPARGQSQRSISSKAFSPPPAFARPTAFELDINNYSEMNSSNKNVSQRVPSEVRSRSNSEMTLRERHQIQQQQQSHMQQRMMMAGPPQPMHPFMFQPFLPPPPGLLSMPPMPHQFSQAANQHSRQQMPFMAPGNLMQAGGAPPSMPGLQAQLEQLNNDQIDRLLDQVNAVIAREQSILEKTLGQQQQQTSQI